MLVIGDQGLKAWLNWLLIDRTVIAPVSGPNGLILFQPVQKVDEIAMNFQNAALSPKDWFFARSEVLFTVTSKANVHSEGSEKSGGSPAFSTPTIVPAKIEREAVIFGIRPCDAHGIALMDKPFLASPEDTLWKEKRDKTALVGLACTKPCAECFCTSMGSGPHDSTGMDIMLTPLGQGFAVQGITEKGKKLLSQAGTQERDFSPPKLPEVKVVNSKGVTEAVRRNFNHAYWDRLADRCLHCNACAYVCPTCYCFDIRDYQEGERTERVRSWESCQSPGFIRAAGGHNPRPAKGARLRQRFAHKLLYFADIFGAVKCTGCGRCVKACPVNIDIREVINDMAKLGS